MMKAHVVVLGLVFAAASPVSAQNYQWVVHSPPSGGMGPVFAAKNRSGELSEWRLLGARHERCNYSVGDDNYFYTGAEHYVLLELRSDKVATLQWVVPARPYAHRREMLPGVGHYLGLRGVPWKVEPAADGTERYFFLSWVLIGDTVLDVWCEFHAPATPTARPPVELKGIEVSPIEPKLTPIPQRKRPAPAEQPELDSPQVEEVPPPADDFLPPSGPLLVPRVEDDALPNEHEPEQIDFDGPIARAVRL